MIYRDLYTVKLSTSDYVALFVYFDQPESGSSELLWHHFLMFLIRFVLKLDVSISFGL